MLPYQILGEKLFSVVPNSMAEERTVSRFTKLDAKDRARQKPATIVRMTQVYQHLKREQRDSEEEAMVSAESRCWVFHSFIGAVE